MAVHKTEKRHIVIEYEYDVSVRVPKNGAGRTGRGGPQDEEEMRSFILKTLRQELTRGGQR